jgi:hypothetical protein
MATAREIIAQRIATDPTCQDLGLDPDSVYQADTAESPEERPFIVVRWGDVAGQMGHVTVRNVDLWAYDQLGDYTRAERLVRAAAEAVGRILQVETDEGFINQVRISGDGLGRGADLVDEGFDALVIPHRVAAVVSEPA